MAAAHASAAAGSVRIWSLTRPSLHHYNLSVETVRLYDPGRRPADWSELIRPDQFAVFAADGAAGAPCDLEGIRFAAGAETCAIVDSIAEARAICDAAVQRHP